MASAVALICLKHILRKIILQACSSIWRSLFARLVLTGWGLCRKLLSDSMTLQHTQAHGEGMQALLS